MGSRSSESFWQGTKGKHCLEDTDFGQSKAMFLLKGADGREKPVATSDL